MFYHWNCPWEIRRRLVDVLSELRCLLEKGEQAVLQVDSGEAAEGGQARPSSVSFFSDSCLSQSHQKRERERERVKWLFTAGGGGRGSPRGGPFYAGEYSFPAFGRYSEESARQPV